MSYLKNLPEAENKRILIVGGGFAGLRVARKLKGTGYQILMIDKNNYHQFQPLFYQVAASGLEPSAISFPLRRIFKGVPNMLFRMVELEKVEYENNRVLTNKGYIDYDYLVLATGADTNYFGMENIKKYGTPMKSVSEALYIRNRLIANFEEAYTCDSQEKRRQLLNVVVVGGGPTGTELAGAIAEMKRYSLPKDYPTMDFSDMRVILVEMGGRLLNGMSDVAGEKSLKFLESLGVEVMLNAAVKDYDGENVKLEDQEIPSNILLWAAGVAPNPVPGLPEEKFFRGRLKVNEFLEVEGMKNIFALGDLAYFEEEKFPKGHPQVAQVAIQMGDRLAKNFKLIDKKKEPKGFSYTDLGSMATIGRKLAVVDLPFIKFQGFIAWLTWLFVHLMAIVGVKNRLFIFMNWAWSYLNFDASLRLLIRPRKVQHEEEELMIDDSK
ncbi:MAG: NAD(P)/FAD-dependent oxidoreductase [Cyclobacteriaceae bacterium]|nr:NAD(P)/FAD-dependent oxidoreductase [Cyclobacteriaceae bacterium]MCH8517436.1 NAD(P)/FAD-dependent oxidoreductase [Cyclobacteriaceae bacterium]